MKTSDGKSPEPTEVTPSKKKLKQARLPFKLISDVSPKPATPQTRKRKLSTPETESVTKVGKICKENDLIKDLVVISDDDSKGSEIPVKDEKSINPFVKLVDTAWKKKQKAKKRKGDKKKVLKPVLNGSKVENETESVVNKKTDTEMMDVDETPTEVSSIDLDIENPEFKTENSQSTDSSANKVNKQKKISDSDKDSVVVVLEDSNNPDDIKPAESDIPITDQEETKSTQETVDPESSKKGEASENKSSKTSPTKEPSAEQVTPKRSARNQAKAEQNNNSKGSPNSKLNDSVCSNPTTPKRTPKTSRSSSVTNSQGDVSINESTTSVNLTPKQVQKKLESAKKRDEKEKEKQEREKKRQQEKEERAKIRQEKEDQKKREREEKEEAKKKEKEEKEEQKRKEREEKEKQKELEKKQREEKEEQKRKEKEEKEEQKRKEKEAREEERRKKQEALDLEKQEQELKKKKAAEAFVNFFVPKQKSDKETTIACVSKNSLLSNFTVKSDMRLAPLVRVDLGTDKKEELVSYIKNQTVSQDGLYLTCLKNGAKPLSNGKTWPLSDKDDDDVMIVEDELPPIDGAGEILTCDSAQREKLRPKLLSFQENRRPPYWGTWRKKSAFVKPRRPFGQDEKQLDYEVDSDEEWEEEQEGESIDGSAAGSDDEQDGDEYEVDNVVFVPHGYLSDEEATMDEDDVLSLSPETQKQRLKHLEDEFESEMKKPTEKLKPRMYGLLWETADGGKPDKCVDAMWNYFGKLSMIMNDPTPLLQPASEPEESEKKKVKKKKVLKEIPDGEQKPKSPKNEKKKKTKTEEKEIKTPKSETKKNIPETKKNQPGINMFLKKLKSS